MISSLTEMHAAVGKPPSVMKHGVAPDFVMNLCTSRLIWRVVTPGSTI